MEGVPGWREEGLSMALLGLLANMPFVGEDHGVVEQHVANAEAASFELE